MTDVPLPVRRKVFAYITHRGRLLVFAHPLTPDAGIQVPAGTLRDGEAPAAGVLREAIEETGRRDLQIVRFLGERVRDMRDFARQEMHHRFFFHLRCTGSPPDTWQHREPDPADGDGELPLFEFFWAPLPDGVPLLIADHGALLPELSASLGTSGGRA